MKRETVIYLLSALLTLMWVYTVVSKLSNLQEFRAQLINQVFSPGFAHALFYLLPLTEILAAVWLVARPRYGFLFSAVLMFVFTGYIILILLGFYARVPCACGGMIKSLGWTGHLFFNICFTVVAVAGYIVSLKERRL